MLSTILTHREKEIVSLIFEGQTSRGIALQLNISEHTVKTHCRNIMSKAGVSSRMNLVRLALQHGLLPDRI